MRENGLRILLIDDDPDDRALARLVLEREIPEAAVEEITDALAFAQACGRRGFALVILERELRWADGLAVLSLLKEDWPEVPVILFTAYGNEEVTLRAVRLGASDYLVKKPANFLRLPLAVRSALDKGRSRPMSGAAGAAPLESLLDRTQVAVFSATPEGRLLDASPGFLLMLGVETFEDAARLDLRPLLSVAADQGSPEGGPGAAQQARLRRADGRPIWVEVIGTVVRDAQGTRIAGLVEDTTARKQAEEEMAARSAQLRRSNEELLQFASMASHELQAPVRMMERYTRLLQEEYEGKLGASGDEMLDLVVSSAQRLSELIEDLLALSRVESRERRLETISVERLLERTLANLQDTVEESGAAVTHSPLPEVEADASLIVQLLQNLIENAIKFQGAETPRVHVSARRAPREWVFSVRDNGRGIDPAEADSVFTIFKRLHPEVPGSGIGLAICRRIVERHGGRIWVESEPGRGSNFLFTLPASREGLREESP
ncbi:MAG TPA: ATP-binding protein [Thermoanaerobaculia bacterium]|jgi:PAS domain S-box-containing protein|nr:ATP-binding protein [Thermoanaerobaculia bacterium]